MVLSLKTAAILTISLAALSGCGRKESNEDDNGNPAALAPAEEGPTNQETALPPSKVALDEGSDEASGCTGEEAVSMLLNATGLELNKLPQAKQVAILQSQGRLPGARDLELSTGAHITNKLNLTAEIGETFAKAWFDATQPEHDAIKSKYGSFPGGDRLALVLFGKGFFERLHGGSAGSDAVNAMGELVDLLDAPGVNPADGAPTSAVDETGKVVALVAAIGTTVCIN